MQNEEDDEAELQWECPICNMSGCCVYEWVLCWFVETKQRVWFRCLVLIGKVHLYELDKFEVEPSFIKGQCRYGSRA